MGISLKGHAPDFQYWVFDIDGKTWVAINQSKTSPLNINFIGTYRDWPSSLPLVNTSNFLISGSKTKQTNDIGEKTGVVEWSWAGNRYISTWVLTAGREISAADPEEGVPATFEYGLNFVGQVPYSGPAGGTVGATIVTPTAVQAQEPGASSASVDETKEALDAANRALRVSESQGVVNVQALNNARIELKNAKDALASAESKATQGQAVQMSQLREQVDAIQERTDNQIRIYQQMLQQAQAAQQVSAAAVSETKEALDAANRSLSFSESQRKVDLQALNNARVELQNAKDALANAESKATKGQEVLMSQLREQVDAIQERTAAQIKIYQQMLQQQQQVQTPPVVSTPVIKPPVVKTPAETPTVETPPSTTAAGPDWVKLGLQLGAAYLLFS